MNKLMELENVIHMLWKDADTLRRGGLEGSLMSASTFLSRREDLHSDVNPFLKRQECWQRRFDAKLRKTPVHPEP